MARGKFDAILIDFYGTISAGDREAVETACTRIVETFRLPITPEAFAVRWGERFFEATAQSNHDAFRTLFECELISLRATLSELGCTGDPAPFLRELEEYWVDPPIHADALEFLRSVELPICCVSNADTQPLAAAIDRLGLRFDAVVTSESARCYKPDPAIFQAAVRKLGVSPQRTLHVGDSLHSDIAGAARIGIPTVWVRRENRIHDIGICKPDYTIRILTELRTVVDG